MHLSVPTCWDDLSQSDLRYVLRLHCLYSDRLDGRERILTASLLHFTCIEVLSRTAEGWLCRERPNTRHHPGSSHRSDVRQRRFSRRFVLDPALLPSLMQPLEWLLDTDAITARLDTIAATVPDASPSGKAAVPAPSGAVPCPAFDFPLQDLPFGKFLETESHFQTYLAYKQKGSLAALLRVLYSVPDTIPDDALADEELLGTLLWYSAAKRLMAQRFPHFLRPATNDPNTQHPTPITQEALFESANAQLRLLTKGDVTKLQYVQEHVYTWEALAELDAQAKEAEDLRNERLKP